MIIYRRKTYIVSTSFVEEFNALFNDILLPAQLKYGARLIGRWHLEVDESTSEIFALWEYDNFEQYEEIESKIKSDEVHVKTVQDRFDQIGREPMKEVLKRNIKQEFLTSLRKKSPTSKREGASAPVKVGDEFRIGVA